MPHIMKEYIVERADTRAKYDGLRDLWHRVFGDEPEFVDHVYRLFGRPDPECGAGDSEVTEASDITGYVVCDDESKVVSALTCYRCGELSVPGPVLEDPEYAGLDGRPVHVSYAVCTDPEYRGLGLAGRLTSQVSAEVTASGGISLVSPAEESLIAFYKALGYRENCFVIEEEALAEDPEEWEAGDAALNSEDTRFWGLGADGTPGFIEDTEAAAPGTELTVEPVDVITYNKYRESFLADAAHVSLSEPMLELVRSVSLNGDGLLVINGGDAVCVISEAPDPEGGETATEQTDGSKTQLIINELLVAPELLELSEEIGGEIASALARYFGTEKLVYRTPAFCGKCTEVTGMDEGISCQSMTAGTWNAKFYFGFPVE